MSPDPSSAAAQLRALGIDVIPLISEDPTLPVIPFMVSRDSAMGDSAAMRAAAVAALIAAGANDKAEALLREVAETSTGADMTIRIIAQYVTIRHAPYTNA